MQRDGVWGPESTCPTCGAPIQRLVSNRYPGGFRTFAAGTLNRHLCPLPPIDSGTMPEPVEEKTDEIPVSQQNGHITEIPRGVIVL